MKQKFLKFMLNCKYKKKNFSYKKEKLSIKFHSFGFTNFTIKVALPKTYQNQPKANVNAATQVDNGEIRVAKQPLPLNSSKRKLFALSQMKKKGSREMRDALDRLSLTDQEFGTKGNEGISLQSSSSLCFAEGEERLGATLSLAERCASLVVSTQRTPEDNLGVGTQSSTSPKAKKQAKTSLPFAFGERFHLPRNSLKKKLGSSYSKLSEVKLITIGLASPLRILQWAEKTLPNGKIYGEVLNANTLHHKTFKPMKGGLFCERIFGPLKDFECACGKIDNTVKQEASASKGNIKNVQEMQSGAGYPGEAFREISSAPLTLTREKKGLKAGTCTTPLFSVTPRKFCPECDVEYTWSVIRRYQLGYIKLISPVTHIWFLKGNPSYLSLLLDMKKRYLQYVTYGSETLTLENSLFPINNFTFNTSFSSPSSVKDSSHASLARSSPPAKQALSSLVPRDSAQAQLFFSGYPALDKSTTYCNILQVPSYLETTSNLSEKSKTYLARNITQNMLQPHSSKVSKSIHNSKFIYLNKEGISQEHFIMASLAFTKIFPSLESLFQKLYNVTHLSDHLVQNLQRGEKVTLLTKMTQEVLGTRPALKSRISHNLINCTWQHMVKNIPFYTLLSYSKIFPSYLSHYARVPDRREVGGTQPFSCAESLGATLCTESLGASASESSPRVAGIAPRDSVQDTRAVDVSAISLLSLKNERNLLQKKNINLIVVSDLSHLHKEHLVKAKVDGIIETNLSIKNSNSKEHSKVQKTRKKQRLFNLMLIFAYLTQDQEKIQEMKLCARYPGDSTSASPKASPIKKASQDITSSLKQKLKQDKSLLSFFSLLNRSESFFRMSQIVAEGEEIKKDFLIKLLCVLPLCTHYILKDSLAAPLDSSSLTMSFLKEYTLLVSLIMKISKKLPLDFYILCLLEQKLQKQILKASNKTTWKNIYTKTYSKASLSSLERYKDIKTNQSILNEHKRKDINKTTSLAVLHEGTPREREALLFLGVPQASTGSPGKPRPVTLCLNIFKNKNVSITTQALRFGHLSSSPEAKQATPAHVPVEGVGTGCTGLHQRCKQSARLAIERVNKFSERNFLERCEKGTSSDPKNYRELILKKFYGVKLKQKHMLFKIFLREIKIEKYCITSNIQYGQHLLKSLKSYLFLHVSLILQKVKQPLLSTSFTTSIRSSFSEIQTKINSLMEEYYIIEHNIISNALSQYFLRPLIIINLFLNKINKNNFLSLLTRIKVPSAPLTFASRFAPASYASLVLLSVKETVGLLTRAPCAERLGARVAFSNTRDSAQGIPVTIGDRTLAGTKRYGVSLSRKGTKKELLCNTRLGLLSLALKKCCPKGNMQEFALGDGHKHKTMRADISKSLVASAGNTRGQDLGTQERKSRTSISLRTPKIYNNVYSLSHRERWTSEKDWQIFILYNSAPTQYQDVPIFAYQHRFYSPVAFGLGGEGSLSYPLGFASGNTMHYTLAEDLGSFASLAPGIQGQEKVEANMDELPSLTRQITSQEVFRSSQNGFTGFKGNVLAQLSAQSTRFGSLATLNNRLSNAFYVGPGIIQQLLFELNFSEIKKLDKQNRFFLYQLNKSIVKLKKQAEILLYDKNTKNALKELCKKRDLLIRRTKLIRKLYRKDSDPSSMILTLLPVLPPDLRPIVKMGDQIAASDLNILYKRVIYRNERLKKFLKDPATSYSSEMKYAQRLLQEAVDNLIQNGKSSSTGGAAEKDSRGRILKSLSDLLKGKQGRFRQFLLGKRVDYSGRSVIVVGPKLKLSECGIPFEMAKVLYLPFLMKVILKKHYARTNEGAKKLIQNNPALIQELLNEIMQASPVLLNRAPTLHRLGIQAFVPKLVEGRAILLHPLVCSAFNADFDGDQMAVHVPITVEARAEAWKLMLSRNNLLSPATGDPLAIPSQDMVLGCYYLTTYSNKGSFHNLKGSGLYFNNFNEVVNAYNNSELLAFKTVLNLHSLIWVKWVDLIENGSDQTEPLEIRVSPLGNWQEISTHYHRLFDSKNIMINQYVTTTPGRILFNMLLQKIT